LDYTDIIIVYHQSHGILSLKRKKNFGNIKTLDAVNAFFAAEYPDLKKQQRFGTGAAGYHSPSDAKYLLFQYYQIDDNNTLTRG